MKYPVVIRGKKEAFPNTKSVLADRIEIVRVRALNKERRMEREALNIKSQGGEYSEEEYEGDCNEETLFSDTCSSDDEGGPA